MKRFQGVFFKCYMGVMLGILAWCVLTYGQETNTATAQVTGSGPVQVVSTVVKKTDSTLLSFGLLAFSSVRGVQSFGLTMLIGVSLSFLLAPLAGRANPRRHEQEN